MAICLDIFLVSDRYDAAGGQDPHTTEWPPHPARAFSALRSVATPDDLPALRALESLPAPIVHASSDAVSTKTRAYVVTNTLTASGGNLSHPGRTSGLRERRSVIPMSPRVQVIWDPDDTLDDATVMRLDEMARRVPYLGRSTSVVLMGVRRVAGSASPAGLDIFRPTETGPADVLLRVPYPGYTDELNALYEQGLSAWQASDSPRAKCAYRLVRDEQSVETPTETIWSPYNDLVVLRFCHQRPAGRLVPILTAALRSTVMKQTDNPLPPALHGHGFEGNPHVAYLGLPASGGPFADGHLVGLAVAIPGMNESERRRILRGVLGAEGSGKVILNAPGFHKPFELEYLPDEPLPRAANAQHWRRPSRQWTTVSPIVLDRYPKNGDLASGVLKSIKLAGLPEPESVEVSSSAMMQGAIDLRPQELPKRAKGRLFCHARVLFEQPVGGPVLVGAGRYFGVGLLQPERLQSGEPNAR